MKLTIFAATGGIGRQLLQQAIEAGHDTTAVARNLQRLSELSADYGAEAIPDTHPHPTSPVTRTADRLVRTVAADLATPDPKAIGSAVLGADAVLSALGARTTADAGVAWRGTRAIVRAMQTTEVRRIIVVSAAPIGTVPSPGRPAPPKHDPGDGFFMRHLAAPLTKAALRAHYADLAHMEEILRDSGLDWTIVRPPRLTDKPVTAAYRTAYGQNLRRGLYISRADVAHYMLQILDEQETIKQTVGIAN